MAIKDFGKLGVAAFWLLAAMSLSLSAQTHQGVQLVEARLVADSETVVPGRPVTLGLHLKMAPGWHTYWEYSGDAGLPTTLELDLPEGFRATALQWPLPQRLVEPGDLEVYAYKDEVLLLTRVFSPLQVEAGEIQISGNAQWLVCEKICLPGQADLSLRLTVSDSLQPANTELFEHFQAQLPQPLRGAAAEEFEVAWARRGQALILEIGGLEGRPFDFYPLPPQEAVLGHPETSLSADGRRGRVRIPLSAAPAAMTRVPGVLVVGQENSETRQGWRIP